jgi:hypothetical protein
MSGPQNLSVQREVQDVKRERLLRTTQRVLCAM